MYVFVFTGDDKHYDLSGSNHRSTGKYDKKPTPTATTETTITGKPVGKSPKSSKSPRVTSAASLARGEVNIKRKTEGFYTSLQVEKLPQTFPVRYLGSVPCSGLYGMDQVRKPLGVLLELYSGSTNRDVCLSYNSASLHACPRTRVEINARALKIAPALDSTDADSQSLDEEAHSSQNNSASDDSDILAKTASSTDDNQADENSTSSADATKSTTSLSSAGSASEFKGGDIPLQLISYASQDVLHPCVFVIMQVIQMSSKGYKSECHAYACHTKEQCKKMALAMALAFKEYAKTLKETPADSPFQLDLEKSKIGTQSSKNETSESEIGSTSLVDDVLGSMKNTEKRL